MALPSEGSETSEIQCLGESLGKSPCIELQGVSRALPKPADQLALVRAQIAALAEEGVLRQGFISGTLPLAGDENTVVVETKTNERIDAKAMRANVAEEVWRPYVIATATTYVTLAKTDQNPHMSKCAFAARITKGDQTNDQ